MIRQNRYVKTAYENEVSKVVEMSRVNKERLHWTEFSCVDLQIKYALTIKGEKVYPSEKDIARIIKGNAQAIKDLNPAYSYIQKCEAQWSKERKGYMESLKLMESQAGEMINPKDLEWVKE